MLLLLRSRAAAEATVAVAASKATLSAAAAVAPEADRSTVHYVMHRTSDGRVMRGGQMPRRGLETYPSAGVPAGQALLEVDREADLVAGEWVVAGALSTPTSLSLSVSSATLDADGVDSVTISGLPNPSEVSISHSSRTITDPTPETVVTDGSVVLKTTLPGTITVKVIAPGKLTWVGTVDAV